MLLFGFVTEALLVILVGKPFENYAKHYFVSAFDGIGEAPAVWNVKFPQVGYAVFLGVFLGNQALWKVYSAKSVLFKIFKSLAKRNMQFRVFGSRVFEFFKGFPDASFCEEYFRRQFQKNSLFPGKFRF